MQDKLIKLSGLSTQFNPLAIAPGALVVADDCYMRRENVIEDRRGYQVYASLDQTIKSLIVYNNKVLAHRGTKLSFDNGSGTFQDFSGSYQEITGSKVKGVEANSNLYLTTSAGVKVFSEINNTASGRLAGAPRALDLSYTLTGSTGFLADQYQCAYRWVIQRSDANANVVTGYPSQRLWVINGAGAGRNVVLTGYLPTEAKTGDVVQVYRTAQLSGIASDGSGDEMGIVYQYELIASDITAGFITFTDSVTDALRGATLYTSPSQEGILQANDRPPVAKDLALYKSNYMLYANTQTKQRLFASLVGAGSLTGKTISLAGVTYNFGSSEIISGVGAPQVKVGATGVAAVDIDTTARSLVKVINRYAGNTSVFAYYLSGPSDLPGQFMVEEKGLGAVAFSLLASDTTIAGQFFPAPPVGTANPKSTSSNDVATNRVYYSKAQQLEAVPALNYLNVGPANRQILRVIALRDSAIIIKEEGVYRLSGETPQSFTIQPIDLTVFCKAPESIVALANQVLMLSNQGVVLISETGVQVISREIEPSLVPLIASPNLATNTSAVGYESERSYFLSTITQAGNLAANQTFVYNIFTRTWVRHTYAFTSAVVELAGDKMYFAKSQDARIFKERKSFDVSDFADPESTIQITALTGTRTVEFTLSGATPDAGWIISQNGTDIALVSITTISGSYRGTLNSDFPGSWTTGAAVIYPSVGMNIQFHSWTGEQSPDVLKQVRTVGVLTDDTPGNNSVSALDVTFASNFDPNTEAVTLFQPGEGWGGAWGASPWGGTGDSAGYPTYVPRNKQYCTRLTVGIRHRVAREQLVITGVAFSFEAASDRIGR